MKAVQVCQGCPVRVCVWCVYIYGSIASSTRKLTFCTPTHLECNFLDKITRQQLWDNTFCSYSFIITCLTSRAAANGPQHFESADLMEAKLVHVSYKKRNWRYYQATMTKSRKDNSSLLNAVKYCKAVWIDLLLLSSL